jgi:hypothetical protein
VIFSDIDSQFNQRERRVANPTVNIVDRKHKRLLDGRSVWIAPRSQRALGNKLPPRVRQPRFRPAGWQITQLRFSRAVSIGFKDYVFDFGRDRSRQTGKELAT